MTLTFKEDNLILGISGNMEQSEAVWGRQILATKYKYTKEGREDG